MAELLTVFLIILIVAAIAFPVFFQAKSRAKQTVCESNLHQIYLAIQLYEQDYNELPYLAHDNPAWVRYTGNTVLRCANTVGQPRRFDYVITAGPLLDVATNKASEKWNAMLDACRLVRGNDFPWAFDPNHRRSVDGYQGNGQRVLLVRANGSVRNVPFRQPGPWMPCDPSVPPELQH